MTEVDGVAGSDSSVSQKSAKKPLPLWQETILLMLLALVLAVVIKSLIVQAFHIPSPSMEPEFVKNDRIVVQKVSYWGSASPSRGDIVVFADPGGWLPPSGAESSTSPVTSVLEQIGLYPAGGHLVKRVIGIGGDHVVCCDAQGRITVNGHPLNEKTYLPKGTKPSSEFDVKVPKDHLWVMGDNRDHSADSRANTTGPDDGFVPESEVVGKVLALMWPGGRAHFIHRPSTYDGVPDSPKKHR